MLLKSKLKAVTGNVNFSSEAEAVALWWNSIEHNLFLINAFVLIVPATFIDPYGWYEATVAVASTTAAHLLKAAANLQDTNFAEETAKITKQSLIKNYALAMVATANTEEMEKLKLLA